MRLAAIALVALASTAACYGNYPGGATRLGDAGPNPIGGGISDGGPDGGDAGADAGDGGIDGGVDAGCAPGAIPGLPAVDGCPSGAPGNPTSAQGAVNADCTVNFNLSTGKTCSGIASGGTANAFDGGCTSGPYRCISQSLPGTLVCVYGAGTLCTIKICDAGTACQ